MQTHLTTKGLVIRETAYQDADKMIDLFTEDGIRTVCVKSARKPGSKYAAVTQLFSYGEFCLRCSGERFYLDSAVSLEMFFGIRNDLEALALASYFSELVRKISTEQPQPQILRLFLLALHHLSEHSRPLMLVKPIFELRLMRELGMAPNLICCAECMQYESAHPVMRIRSADFVCRECECGEIEDARDMPVTQAVLHAARHVVFTDFDRLYQFRLKGCSAGQFAEYAERYLKSKLNLHFQSLDFFHKLYTPTDDTQK